MIGKRHIYLDHASTTPLDRRVRRIMLRLLRHFANPSALYEGGQIAKKYLKEARIKTARVLSARPEEVIFTASGTESDNLALFGIFEAAKKTIAKPRFISTNIEHPAILETLEEIEKRGGEVILVPVEQNGIVSVKEIERQINDRTVLVSVMYANNEIGTIQPIKEISRMLKTKCAGTYPYLHTDASQAPNYLSVDTRRLGVELMTLDGSKIYGPKGVGALFIKSGTVIEPIIFGGGQEFGLRSGTENVPAIVAFAEALAIASEEREKESRRLHLLQKHCFKWIEENKPAWRINGDLEKRLPNNLNVCIGGLDAEFAVIKLAEKGIDCSYASACLTRAEENQSYVIEALGKNECAGSSLRFTFGRSTTKRDIKKLLATLADLV